MSGLQMKSAADEKSEVLERLRGSRERLLAAVDAVAPTFCQQCAAAGRWTVLQCMEHVVNAEEGMLKLWTKLGQPGTGDRGKDDFVRAAAADRSRKKAAPERVLPLGKIKSMVEARERFVTARQRTIVAVEQMPDEELRNKIVPHPLTGTADGYQLFQIMAMHSERHAEQIHETAQQLAAGAGGE